MSHPEQQHARFDTRATSLCLRRTLASRAFRVAAGIAALWAVAMSSMVLIMRGMGDVGPFPGVVRRTVVMTGWTSAALLAISHARGGFRHADEDPWIRFAAFHGIGARQMRRTSLIVATVMTASVVWLSAVPVAITSAATASSWSGAALQVFALLPLALVALAIGLVAGWLSAEVGRLFPKHGLLALAVVVLVPWMLDGWLLPTRSHVTSIPGLITWMNQWVSHVGWPT